MARYDVSNYFWQGLHLTRCPFLDPLAKGSIIHRAVGLLGQASPDPAGQEDHGLRFQEVSLQAHPIKQANLQVQGKL